MEFRWWQEHFVFFFLLLSVTRMVQTHFLVNSDRKIKKITLKGNLKKRASITFIRHK